MGEQGVSLLIFWADKCGLCGFCVVVDGEYEDGVGRDAKERRIAAFGPDARLE